MLAHRRRVLRDANEYGFAKAARKHGLSRNTLYRWRDQLDPVRPGPKRRVSWQTSQGLEQQVVEMRKKTHFGPKRLKAELALLGVHLGEKAIRGIIERAGLTKKQRKKRRKKKGAGFYTPYPGYRIQIDTKAIPDPGIDKRSSSARYQFTAIDTATRIRFCMLYDELSNSNSIAFLKQVISFFTEIGIKIECIQTDNHGTFTNLYTGGNKKQKHQLLRVHPFTNYCLIQNIEHVLSRPSTPQDNCFVERSHRTDDEEFYSFLISNTSKPLNLLSNQELLIHMKHWNHVYNCLRLHSSCHYLPPMKYYYQHFASSVT